MTLNASDPSVLSLYLLFPGNCQLLSGPCSHVSSSWNSAMRRWPTASCPSGQYAPAKRLELRLGTGHGHASTPLLDLFQHCLCGGL